jgi:hypothetical protein
MSDANLLRFGKAARNMCSPEANLGKPPRQVFVIQLDEARGEWQRRKEHSGTFLRDLDDKHVEVNAPSWIRHRSTSTALTHYVESSHFPESKGNHLRGLRGDFHYSLSVTLLWTASS